MAGKAKRTKPNRLERNDRLVRLALLLFAFSAVSILLVITLFIVQQGTPIMFKYGLKSFLAGKAWYPSEKVFGLWPMIVGSVYVTLGAMVLGVPFGLACAIVLTEFSSKRLRRLIKPVAVIYLGQRLKPRIEFRYDVCLFSRKLVFNWLWLD